MPNEILTKTGIGYGTTDNITAIYIGGNSIFEVNIEKRNFEGQNKVAKIEEVPVIKITFFELTLSLIEFLKKSTTSANGVIFYDIDGLYDGVYQSRYEEDEFKQQAVLSLYQKYPIEFSPFWMGTLLDLGMPKIFPFGKSNFAINSTEFSLDNSLIEKSVNSEVERFKFSGINRYFFNDSNSWKITINDLAITNSETLLKLKPYKGSMVSFTPHLDRLDIVHHNIFCDYEEKISNNQKSVEISLKQINKTIDRNFVYPPVIYVSGNYIFMQAGINAEVYYTFKIESWPADPISTNWTKYNTEIELANGYYKAIAKIGDNVSGVVEKEIDLAILAKPSILLISGYIRMLADQGAEIFYTMNRYTQPGNPTSDDTKFTADFAVEYGYYKAIAKKNNKYSTITVQAISPAVVAPPVITKSGNTIVMTAEPFAKIYYTINGSDPLANGSDSFEYTQPIPVTMDEVKAISVIVGTISAAAEFFPYGPKDYMAYYLFEGNYNDSVGNNHFIPKTMRFNYNSVVPLDRTSRLTFSTPITYNEISINFRFKFKKEFDYTGSLLTSINDEKYYLMVNGLTGKIGYYNTSYVYPETSFFMEHNKTYDIVVIKSDKIQKVYINGSFIYSNNDVWSNSEFPLSQVVGITYPEGRTAMGEYYPIKIFNRSLTEAEAIQLTKL